MENRRTLSCLTSAALIIALGGPFAARSPQAPAAKPDGTGRTSPFFDLTVPRASAARVITYRDMLPSRFFSQEESSRWIVSNTYLPADRLSFNRFYHAASQPDGTLFVMSGGLVSASETGLPPRGNGVWYADNGVGVWRVDPEGRVTAFAVRELYKKINGQYSTTGCNVKVAESAIHPETWGGMAVSPKGDVFVSDSGYHAILRLRSDGYVELVAGGGQQPCVRDPWKKTSQSGYRDGPGSQALFNGPAGLAFDREGNLLVADQGNCALRKIGPTGDVTTVRKGCAMGAGDAEKPEKRINYTLLVIDPQGRPVVGGSLVRPSVDIYSNIHRLNPDGSVEQLLSASKGYANSGRLRLEYLTGFTYLPDGTLLVSDEYNNLIRRLNEGSLSDWLGAQGDRGEMNVDGPATLARVRKPGELFVTADGTVFIKPADFYAPLRKVDRKTRAVSSWLY